MRYPNLRYGNPTELAYYAIAWPLLDLARMRRRDERTVRDWIKGRTRVPWWVPEILRLKRLEADLRYRQMFSCVLDQKPLTTDTRPRHRSTRSSRTTARIPSSPLT